jgi:hypothetical protein
MRNEISGPNQSSNNKNGVDIAKLFEFKWSEKMNTKKEISMSVKVFVAVLVAISVVSQIGFAGTYVGVPKGTIYQAYVDYNDSDTVTITTGYGECNGHYWEITSPINHDMTSLAAAEDYHYIYIYDCASDYPVPAIIDSTNEPAWSDSKLGWYDEDNRCIGVVWSPEGSATVITFTDNSNLEYACDSVIKVVMDSNGNPSSTWQFLEATAYTPVNAVGVFLYIQNADYNNHVWMRIAAEGSLAFQIPATAYGGTACATGWLPFSRGASRDFYWQGEDDDDNVAYVGIRGYRIER